MQRTKQDIYALIEKGETFHLECKKAQGGLPSSLWESYSAFCNTDGGVMTMPTVDLTEDSFQPEGGVKGGVKTTADRILAMIESDAPVTYQRLAKEIGITENAITKHIKHLSEANLIRRVGPKKGGHWEIVKPQPPTGGPGS